MQIKITNKPTIPPTMIPNATDAIVLPKLPKKLKILLLITIKPSKKVKTKSGIEFKSNSKLRVNNCINPRNKNKYCNI